MNRRTRFRIFMRDDFTCQYCGRKAPETELHVDHRHPRSKGGADTDDNFVTACILCNSGKSDMVIPVTYKYQGGGPRDGQTVRRTDQFPAEWVWQVAGGELVSLADAYVETSAGAERRFVFGPHAYERHYQSAAFERFQVAVKGAVGSFPDGRSVRLLGAYLSGGLHPAHPPTMDWFDCEQVVLFCTLTLGDMAGVPGVRLSILDPDV